MNTVFALLVAFLGSAAAFAPAPRAFARTQPLQSHFSTIKTQLKDNELLLSTLEDLNVPGVTVGTDLPVRGYDGQIVNAEVAIAQSNGQDIGFRFNGDVRIPDDKSRLFCLE